MTVYPRVKFSDLADGDLTTQGWTRAGNTFAGSFYEVNDGVMEHYITNTSVRYNYASYDAIESDPDRDDVDVVALIEIGGTPSIFVRANNSVVSYHVHMSPSSIILYRTSGNGSSALNFSSLASRALVREAGSLWWLRIRVEGTTIKVMAWLDGTLPPDPEFDESWDIILTDTVVTGVGSVGLGTRSSGAAGGALRGRYHAFQVATGGDFITFDVEPEPGDVLFSAGVSIGTGNDGILNIPLAREPLAGNLLVIAHTVRTDRGGTPAPTVFPSVFTNQRIVPQNQTGSARLILAWGIATGSDGDVITVETGNNPQAGVVAEIQGPAYLSADEYGIAPVTSDNPLVLGPYGVTSDVPQLHLGAVAIQGSSGVDLWGNDFLRIERVSGAAGETSSNIPNVSLAAKVLDGSDELESTYLQTGNDMRFHRGILVALELGVQEPSELGPVFRTKSDGYLKTKTGIWRPR